MACSRGLFFAQVNDMGEVRVTLNQNEVYFREQDVKAAIEFRRDLIVTCMDMDLNAYIIDRKSKAVLRTIENPSGSDNPLCMRLIPQFDYDKLPFAIMRDKDALVIINLRNATAFKVFQSWYQQLPFPQMLMEVQKSPESAAIVLYVLEYSGKDSALVKYELSPDYIGGLRIMVRNDM